jgi:MFS family permease
MMIKLLFAGTIFSSAFLLFMVQPIVSKNILPWFGGSAGVWAICMAFFQVVLLLGYAYSAWISKHLRPKSQVALHIVLLIASLLSLPVIADASWKPTGNTDPSLWILFLLISTVGLPYFVLSTTGPLLQSWVSQTLISTRVYRFFSLSNLASLIALLCYPFFIEPFAPLAQQANAWSLGYVVFIALCAASGVFFYRNAPTLGASDSSTKTQALPGSEPSLWAGLLWLSLSAMGSWLLVAVTNHITQNVAAIPFLWLLPLTLYLFTFVLCFESDRWYQRSRFLLPTALFLGLCAYGLQAGDNGETVKIAIPLYATGLFVICMFLHGELANLKPAPRYLTRFYLMVSLGGAVGGIIVALVAPYVLPAYYELGISFVIVSLIAMRLHINKNPHVKYTGGLALNFSGLVVAQVKRHRKNARRVERNFYGTLMTLDAVRPNPVDNVRQLYHGSVRHGEQYLAAFRKDEPTTYYGPTSGIGLAMTNSRNRQHKNVGLIGLGAGTLAIYGKPGDLYRFYEINPRVIDLAQHEFTFMQDSQASIETLLGDARLVLEKESSNNFDVLAVDAFSGDSIPVHLITREAMKTYKRHISDGGIIAFHVTNRFLSLAPVVEKLALDQNMVAVLVHDEANDVPWSRTDWVLVAKSRAVLQQQAIVSATSKIAAIPGLRVWTDDFNNLFQVIK